jgi:hypothetical protein
VPGHRRQHRVGVAVSQARRDCHVGQVGPLSAKLEHGLAYEGMHDIQALILGRAITVIAALS